MTCTEGYISAIRTISALALVARAVAEQRGERGLIRIIAQRGVEQLGERVVLLTQAAAHRELAKRVYELDRAPPGFEPVMEVLQAGSGASDVLLSSNSLANFLRKPATPVPTQLTRSVPISSPMETV